MVRVLILILFAYTSAFTQQVTYSSKNAGNPLIPGYFADPTVKKFGDTYYIYATTDGNGGGFGPSQVWMSKDFVNWSLQDMNWPTTHHYWAPDVTQAKDGKYYMYYSKPVEIFGASSDSAIGPWTALLPPTQPVVKNFLVPNVITLDGQTFRDDDGKMYMFWGTWGIYPNHGCGVGLLKDDMKSFVKMAQIPNTDLKDFFEAPFMFKRNGIYYLTYSSGRCEDGTYRVQYATSKKGPMGPFVYGNNSPILVTNEDGTVHGPGHQSVLEQSGKFYLIYHRHNNPHSGGGYHRQVAADQLTFDEDGNINKIKPSHSGIGYLAKNVNPFTNLAQGKTVSASSSYSDDFKSSYAVDDNNGTLWKAKSNSQLAWITIDLGKATTIKNVHTQFEYATWYYQYILECSNDRKNWSVYADRSKNRIHGSPMVDVGNARARYLRLRILNTEYPGLNKAVWNIKVYDNNKYQPKMAGESKIATPIIKPLGLLVSLDANMLEINETIAQWRNRGKLGGQFETSAIDKPIVDLVQGRKAVVFDGKTSMQSSFMAPRSLSGNSSFSVAMWVFNPEIGDEEPIVSWTDRGGTDLTNASFGFGKNKKWGVAAHWGWPDMPFTKLPEAGKWHHIAIVFDGTNEHIYINGRLDRKELKMLYLANLRNFILGTNSDKNALFSGALASLKIYDIALPQEDILTMAEETNPTNISFNIMASKFPYGKQQKFKNEGALAGFLTLTNEVEVKDIEGKIALDLNGNNMAKTYAEIIKGLTMKGVVEMEVHAKALGIGWHHFLKIGGNKIYINGRLTNEIINPDAIASITIYKNEVAGLHAKWKTKNPTKAKQLSFTVKSAALSTDIIELNANMPNLSGTGYQYLFTEITGTAGGKSSGWLNSPNFLNFNVVPNQKYAFTVKAKDNYGNVTEASKAITISTESSLFNVSTEIQKQAKNYLLGINASIWDGLLGKADTVAYANGNIKLVSTHTKWDGNEVNGPFLFKNVTGDFIVQVNVSDVSGLRTKKANGANDVGLMIHSIAGPTNFLQSSVFPGWNVGNMITNLENNDRKQIPSNLGWAYYPHLQIQRAANWFYFRGSHDGKNWQDLPGSPLLKSNIGNTVQVGLFHATYGEQSGYGIFEDFKIIQRKY